MYKNTRSKNVELNFLIFCIKKEVKTLHGISYLDDATSSHLLRRNIMYDVYQ